MITARLCHSSYELWLCLLKAFLSITVLNLIELNFPVEFLAFKLVTGKLHAG